MRPASRVVALSAADAAWLALLPCAIALVAAIALAGPWLGRTFMGPGDEFFWAAVRSGVVPEPEEHGRYAVALLGPLLVAGAAASLVRNGARLSAPVLWALIRLSQLLAVAFVVVCVVAQHRITYDARYSNSLPFERVYFTVPTLVVAAAIALGLALVLQRPALTARAATLLRDTRGRQVAAVVVALGLTATWLLTALVFDASAQSTSWPVVGNILWSMNETYAVLNGSGPLTGFHAQYGQLWPYVAAAPMALLGPSTDVHTVTLACIDAAALLAVFAVLRRIARSSLAALLLYAPFLATGFFMKLGPLDDRYAPSNLFSVWPTRYAGPYLLAWLTARHIDRLAPRRRVLLFVAAGLVAINNPEFGSGAFAATLVAVLCAPGQRGPRALLRLAGTAALGLAGAAALVALLTLVVVGELPRFPQLFEFSRIYGMEGWAMLPIPTLGLHLVIYCTFAAALVVAAVRVLRHDTGDVLTAMLGWTGAFGLVAGAYYAGRSHPEVLIDLFSAWSLALALLVVVVVRAVMARPSRRVSLPELAVLAGFGVAICSLAQTPAPWSQVQRLSATAPTRIIEQPRAVRFVRESTRPGEPVAILIRLSHRIAHDAGLVNVSPYTSIDSMPTRRQLLRTVDALRAAGGTRLFTPTGTLEDLYAHLQRLGFEPARGDRREQFVEWVDDGG